MANDDRNTYQQSIPLQTVESSWKQIFDRYDIHQNGQVPLAELRNAVENFNSDNLPPQAVSRILKKYDTNHDDCLSFPEFLDLIFFFAYDMSMNPQTYVNGPLATVCIYNPRRRKEAWRYLSYMLVHNGPLHLIVNFCVQILLGVPLEMVHGWYRVLIIYFSGVIAGSLGTSVSDPYVWLAGASGGVYAIIAAHLATIVMNWSEMQYALLQLIIFLFVVGYDVGNSIHQRYFLNAGQQIGYEAHFAGAMAGLLVGLRILRNFEVHSWEKTVYRVAIVLYFILMTAAILWNILEPEYYPTQAV